MIREYLVQHERARLNREGEQSIPMAPTKDGLGYWRRLRSILLLIFPAYNVSGPLKIKVSGDGRRCGRKRSQVMITFSILNAGSLSVSPDHHYTLALWEGHEDYDAFKEQLGDLLQDLRDAQNTGISLGDVNIPIVLYLSGDWKFIAIIMGLKSASAQEGFCIWCIARKSDLAGKEVFTLRSLAEVLRAFSSGRCTIPGQERPPLFDFIPFDRVIIDPLHAFLRISEKLIDLAFEEVTFAVHISFFSPPFSNLTHVDDKQALEIKSAVCASCVKGRRRSCHTTCDCCCHTPITDIIEAEMHRLGIRHFEFFEGKKKSDLCWTSLQGDEKMAVLKNFDLTKIFASNRAQVSPVVAFTHLKMFLNAYYSYFS